MSKQSNPYEVLGIPDFSDISIVEIAYQDKIKKIESIKDLSENEKGELIRINEAYDKLSSVFSKSFIDNSLNEKNITSGDHEENQLKADDFNKEDSLSLGHSSVKKKERGGFPNYIIIILLCLLALIIGQAFLSTGGSNINEQQKKILSEKDIHEKTNEETKKASQEISVSNQFIENPSEIDNNEFYPNPLIFKQKELFFTPNGGELPESSGLVVGMRQLDSGNSSILIKNQLDSPVIGKLIVKYSEDSRAKVLRYFYISRKEELLLVQIPSGSFQIQSLTTVNPVAHVSPVFKIALFSDVLIRQDIGGDAPYDASLVF